jgi:ABC-2 type transport system permease protein
MKPRWLLRKELTWSRHQLLPLVLILLIVPSTAAFTALGFQHVLPEDTPVAVVPAEETTEEEYRVVVGALTTFTDPVRYDSEEQAMRAMEREQVYAVVTVPAGLSNDSANVTLTMYRDGNVVPYEQPGEAIANVLDRSLGRLAPAEVHVRTEEVGTDRTLSQYLVPSFVMILSLLLSFAYLPYALVQEAAVVDRVRFQSSLGAVVAGKVATFTVLSMVPLVSAAAASAVIGYDISRLAPGAVFVYALPVLYTGAFAAAVTVLARFESWGRLANLATMLFLFTFSGIVYPVGFFSAVRRELIRFVPVHYSMVVARGHVLKGTSVGVLSAEYAVVGATTVVCLAMLWGSLYVYERRA